MVNDVASAQCAHCNMFGHSADDCAMLTGEYDEGKFLDDDEEYVDYYAEYDNYLRACGESLCDPMEQEEDGGEGNTLTEEEYAQWMREAEEEDEYADYVDNHSPEADVRWVMQSSMAAFDHFQRTGAQLRNSEFVGKKAGAYLKSEMRDE
jgi:hypothetical protein